ncbi:ATP-dependent chaperone ClpB [Pseudomonas sp. StFLB209]|nr:ATP-dependent chaperone ClpB [Pseudomonas sp. StFLB209]
MIKGALQSRAEVQRVKGGDDDTDERCRIHGKDSQAAGSVTSTPPLRPLKKDGECLKKYDLQLAEQIQTGKL